MQRAGKCSQDSGYDDRVDRADGIQKVRRNCLNLSTNRAFQGCRRSTPGLKGVVGRDSLIRIAVGRGVAAISRSESDGEDAMPSQEEALERIATAERSGQLSTAAAVQIRRWLAEPPFQPYRDRLVADIAEGRWKDLDNAFYAVLEFGTGGRRGRMYPVGTNVLNDRTIAESARGLADYVTARKGATTPRSLRDRLRHPAQLAASSPSCAPGAGGGRVQGLPVPGAPLDPPALLRRAAPEAATPGS